MKDNTTMIKKQRRPQGERSEIMQKRLLDAAVTVLQSKGFSGFRTAEVVEIAGVSKGALLHHFPTKVALLAAAFEWLRQGTDVSELHFRKRNTIDEIIQDLIAESRAFFFGESFQVTLDVSVSAARTPELRDTIFDSVRGMRRHTEEHWIESMTHFGLTHRQAANIVILVNTVFRGSAVRALWDPDKTAVDQTVVILNEMIESYVKAHQDEVS